MMLHILGALLLPLCGWLAGDAIQARTVQHLAALQKCLALLERIRQEVAFRRADLQQLYAELCREGILESGARCLQEAPPPEGLTREEQQCFRTCMSGLGRAEAQQECEQLDYYRARLQALQQTAEHAARRPVCPANWALQPGWQWHCCSSEFGNLGGNSADGN